ncbi:30S ribosomal protein S16 [candidate division TM6 bacterium RIFCSPHIGHO2_12_FULL_32_22]|nr:MAG: 30S ribosomal protein S16 [candidate division TM6 bacterium RIFCSPHIGHO2_12_FULL_32_22]
MSVKLRLTRIGRIHAPIYRIIATDSKSPRDGKFIEILGTYNPASKEIVQFKEEKINDWISKGALPSDSVKKIIKLFKEKSA